MSKKKTTKELVYDTLMKPKVDKLVDDFVSGNWVCPECNGKPPKGKFCFTCQWMGTENEGKISRKDYVNNFDE